MSSQLIAGVFAVSSQVQIHNIFLFMWDSFHISIVLVNKEIHFLGGLVIAILLYVGSDAPHCWLSLAHLFMPRLLKEMLNQFYPWKTPVDKLSVVWHSSP